MTLFHTFTFANAQGTDLRTGTVAISCLPHTLSGVLRTGLIRMVARNVARNVARHLARNVEGNLVRNVARTVARNVARNVITSLCSLSEKRPHKSVLK